MRRVFRSSSLEPAVLRGVDSFEAKVRLVEFFRLSVIDRHRRRAPVQTDVYTSEGVVNALAVVFHSKCAYCEIPVGGLDHGQVSHHRPIGSAAGLSNTPQDAPSPDHYGWLAYEWNNLFLSCKECNRAKRNLFPLRGPRAHIRSTWREVESSEDTLLINPCRQEPRRHLTFGMDGQAIPKDEVGRVTIDVLELNREHLVQARARKFEMCLNALAAMQHSPNNQKRLQDELGDAAPFSGAAQIAVFDLMRDWCREFRLTPPTFKNIAVDALRLAAIASKSQWYELLSQKNVRNSLVKRQSELEYFHAAPLRAPQVLDKPRTSLLTSIHIKKFKGVRELRLDVAPTKRGDESVPCMMLLGENSTGKSTTLQAIALALMGRKMRAGLRIDAEDFIPREENGWQIDESSAPEVTLEFDTGDAIHLRINPESKEFIGTEDAPFRLFAYGSRRFFAQELSNKRPMSSLRSLFDPFTKIQHPGRWLQELTDEQFDAVARAIRPVLALQAEDRIERDEGGRLFVHAHGRDTPLDRLSDGYRSLMAMVLDIMRGMLGEWGDLYNARGIVLIDEIETHLHPRWKLHVVSALRQAMPNVQFIATTHDPLCLRGLRTGEVEVLVRNAEHHIEALTGLPDVRGLRAEQLLTSEYFGLASTADPDLERALHRAAQPDSRSGRDPSARATLLAFQWIGDTLPQQIANEATKRFIEEVAAEPSLDRSQVREAAVNEVLERLRRLRAR